DGTTFPPGYGNAFSRSMVRQNEREFFAADPKGFALGAGYFDQASTDASEDSVTGGMTMRVVDSLEVIDGRHDERQGFFPLLGLSKCPPEIRIEGPATEKLCQRVTFIHCSRSCGCLTS